MPNYIANGLGGIGNSGVYPDSRPQINVADTINSIASAYNNTKQGVLSRAVMQAQNQRANTELGLQQQHQEMELRAQGWRPADEVTPPVQAPTPPPGPIAAAYQGNAPLPGVGGMPSPGRVMSMAPQAQPTPAMLPAAAPSGPITASSPPPPMQITGGALPAPAAQSQTSAGDGTVAPGPGAAMGSTGTPSAPRMNVNGRDYVLGVPPALQRQIDMRRSALQSVNTTHPGLITPEEAELGAHDDKAFDQLFARKDKADLAKQDYQNKLSSLDGATDLEGKPLSDSLKQMLARNPSAYGKYSDLMLNPPKDPVKIHEAEKMFDNANPGEKPSHYSFVTGVDANGKPAIYRGNSSTGELEPTGVAAKAPGGAGGQGSQKAQTYVDLMQGAFPTMEKLAGKIRPDVVSAAVLHPNAGNLALNQDEQDYLASARSFLAGVLHQESGARLSHEQLQFGMLRYLPNIGDTQQTIQNKLAAARQVIQERAGELSGGKGTPKVSGGSASGGLFDDLVPKQ